ncbi:MAG TPA: hypothetical protein VJ021_03555 [Thermoplasmata archaeon]|nr:hypothetical protein [Thermoplasmata archaeon]
MRSGLVVIGVVIAVLGAGLVLTLFILSGGQSVTTQYRPQDPSLSPGFSQNWIVPGPIGGSGSMSVSWTSSSSAGVALWPTSTCTAPGGFCPTGVPLLNWTAAEFGQGTVSSASGSAYILIVTNSGNTDLRFTGLISVTYSPGSAVPDWSWGLIAAGGIVLLTIGGVALFLGLYLPTGVYRDPDAGPVAIRHPSLPPDDPELDSSEEPP